tara:strand:- start:2339 stop:2569 length:231 start_codon:yes stop_codon:yes gene_type:complete
MKIVCKNCKYFSERSAYELKFRTQIYGSDYFKPKCSKHEKLKMCDDFKMGFFKSIIHSITYSFGVFFKGIKLFKAY